jgi:pyruvate/2-oxoglutarate/acetoin dehydrogenase E1 component
MATRGNLYGELRIWVTPAAGAGLLGAGLAMALGMSPVFAPLVGVLIIAAILSVGQWRLKHRSAQPPSPPV